MASKQEIAQRVAQNEYKAFIDKIDTLSNDDIDMLMIRDIESLSHDDLVKLLRLTRSRIVRDDIILAYYNEISDDPDADDDDDTYYTKTLEAPDFYDIEACITHRILRMKRDNAKKAVLNMTS